MPERRGKDCKMMLAAAMGVHLTILGLVFGFLAVLAIVIFVIRSVQGGDQ